MLTLAKLIRAWFKTEGLIDWEISANSGYIGLSAPGSGPKPHFIFNADHHSVRLCCGNGSKNEVFYAEEPKFFVKLKKALVFEQNCFKNSL